MKEDNKLENPSKELYIDKKSTTSTGTKTQGHLEKEGDSHDTPSNEKEKEKATETTKEKKIEKKEFKRKLKKMGNESVDVDFQLNYLRLQLIAFRKTYDDESFKAALINAIPYPVLLELDPKSTTFQEIKHETEEKCHNPNPVLADEQRLKAMKCEADIIWCPQVIKFL